MKRVVKLNRQQLRGLFGEAIQRREPGSPEPFAINESHEQDLIVQTFTDAVEDDWRVHMQNVAGTGAEFVGDAERQLQRAVMDLAVEVHRSLETVWQRLIHGEYNRGGR